MRRSLHSPAYEVFRTLLAQVRLERGVTQTALAAVLDCPQSAVSKVERGERRLDFTEFIDWVDALDMDSSAFIESYRRALRSHGLLASRRPVRDS